MSIMGRFAKMDSQLQRGLDNAFAAVLGGRVVPAEIEELLKQEAMDNLTATEDDHVFTPNVYTVGVSSRDLENLSTNQELPGALADVLSRFARNQGWELVGEPVVRVAEESGLRTGQLRVSSDSTPHPAMNSGFDAISHDPEPEEQSVSPEPEEAAVPDNNQPDTVIYADAVQATEPAVTLLLQDGSSRTYHVHEGSNIIGRSNDADLRLPDTGVSRQHAEITWDGNDAVLVDLESTNGTTVNSNPIDNWLLRDGDVITMGHSHIEIRIVDPSTK